METILTIRDEVTSRLGRPDAVFTLRVTGERVTVRELIRARVHAEVDAYNAHQTENFRGLVQPAGAELTLNGYRLARPRPLNGTQQAELALAAFEQNGFILLVNDQQAESLDTTVALAPDMTVTFLKLVPLVGG